MSARDEPASRLYVDARILGPDGRDTTRRAFAVREGRITWSASGATPAASRIVSLRDAVVTPGFVDAHAHLTPTGLLIGGVRLAGSPDRRAMLRRVASYCRSRPDRFVWGDGWDDSTWLEPATADGLERVAADRFVYLARVDAHSAIVSPRLLREAGCADREGAERDAAGEPTGVVRRDAHHAARGFFLSRLPRAQIRAAQRAAAEAAASVGITTVHEMGGPLHAAGERDLDLLLEDRLPVRVVCYYATGDLRVATDRRLRQIGGDVNVDGALGSRTAALGSAYADAKGHRGFLYRDAADVGELFESATHAGLQAGVHCIGDAACEAAVVGLERAARRAGRGAVRAARHRLEHFEMASPDLIARAAKAGAAFSVQPAFDAAWGGDDGMYARRLGRRRARAMNDFRAMAASGAPFGFGSDSPVTPFAPMDAIRAAVEPTNPAHALSPEEAFRAATEGAARLAPATGRAGRIEKGYAADFVVWDAHPLTSRRARIRATVTRGRVVYGLLP